MRLIPQSSVILVCVFLGAVSFAGDRNSRGETYLKASEIPHALRFGSEMTLSSSELVESYPEDTNAPVVSSPLADEFVGKIRDSLRLRYASEGGQQPIFTDKNQHSRWQRHAFSIQYPDGFQLTLFPDPGVIELNSAPSSLIDIEKNKARIQRDYFEEGKKLGLAPAAFTGSGHIHIEVARIHPVTLRNFLARFYNATGLAAGALNEDVFNSIGIGETPEANKQILRNAFSSFDKSWLSGSVALVEKIQKAYTIPLNQDLPEYQKARTRQRPDKYFAMSYRSYSSIGTIEIRSIRPQASAESYLKLLKLFAAEMQLAERERESGILVPIGQLESRRGDPQAVIKDFDRYLSEAGLRLEDYREFVLPWWQHPGGEFDHYLKANPRKTLSCESLF